MTERLHLAGDLSIDVTDVTDVTDQPEVPEPTGPASLGGRVFDAATTRPIAGVAVAAEAVSGAGGERPVGLGRGRTDVHGEFRIDLAPGARDALLSLRATGRPGLRFEVSDPVAGRLATTEAVPVVAVDVRVEIPVSIPVDAGIPDAAWTELARRARDLRIARVCDLVQELWTGSLADALGGDRAASGAQRALLLRRVEQEFLDPTGALRAAAPDLPSWAALEDPSARADYVAGLRLDQAALPLREAVEDLLGKVDAFDRIDEVDWVFPADELGADSIGLALNKYSDSYKKQQPVDLELPGYHTSPVRYRDYLLAIWTTPSSASYFGAGPQPTAGEALSQVETRFHQTFTTTDDADRSANEVLIAIITEVLTSPAGSGFGFGVPAAAVPARGAATARTYLDQLIALTGLGAAELGLRYRIDLGREDHETSSPVRENIHALQGFFRDGFQSAPEPWHATPDVLSGPIVPVRRQGIAPFFLYYEEWARQQDPFFPENLLDLRLLLPVTWGAQERGFLEKMATGLVPAQLTSAPTWRFVRTVLTLNDALQEGHTHYRNGEFELARLAYQRAAGIAVDAFIDTSFTGTDVTAALVALRKAPVGTAKDLAAYLDPLKTALSALDYGMSADDIRDLMAVRLVVWTLYVLPVCLGDTLLALGDFTRASFHYGFASRTLIAAASESDAGGYKPYYLDDSKPYDRGNLPYTIVLHQFDRDAPGYTRYPPEAERDEFYDTSTYDAVEEFAADRSAVLSSPVQKRLFKLRHANALLEWADELYRSDTAAGIARARELYKAVLWMWGETVPIEPRWPSANPVLSLPPGFLPHVENPAIVSQKQRARLGFFQIDAGLNYFGQRDDVVPALRYRPLKESADRLAALAKAAQTDFLDYTEKVESALVARMQLSTLLQKGTLQASIATEQIGIAQHDVAIAKDQAAAVEVAIKAKQDEIAKADSLFSQFGDFFDGIKKTFTSLPDDTQSAVKSGVMSQATGDELVGEGMLGLGAGASVLAGYGIFVYAGYTALSGMEAAANKRHDELITLDTKGRAAAQEAVVAKERGVTIAGYQKQIAQADVDLARSLLAFEQDKVLNVGFWVSMAQLARRLMRRYLELGARTAWLAERALAHEQDRTLRVVRLDYFPERLQGITGADLLQLDLAELEATWIDGIRRTVPVKVTYSLLRDFPLALGQLKKHGRCTFRTGQADLRAGFPGTRRYRIRAASTTVAQVDLSAPVRGMLINSGISTANPDEAEARVLVRPAEAAPISEFRLAQDMSVYGLPDQTLLTFEGTHLDTFWEISCPPAANGAALESLLDVLVTLDLRAEFVPDLYLGDLAATPTTTRHWILMRASTFSQAGLAALRAGAPSASLVFDPRTIPLPRREAGRSVTNAAVLLVNPPAKPVAATLASSPPAAPVHLTLEEGVAMSTLQPDPGLPALPPTPLDALAGADPGQRYTLTLTKAANPGVDLTSVQDVVLALEYTAAIA